MSGNRKQELCLAVPKELSDEDMREVVPKLTMGLAIKGHEAILLLLEKFKQLIYEVGIQPVHHATSDDRAGPVRASMLEKPPALWLCRPRQESDGDRDRCRVPRC
jgi:hypothetical protein